MFRHVVMFKFVDTVTAEQKLAVLEGLSRLPNEIGQIRSFSFGEDARVVDGNYDVVVVADFDSSDDYLVYASHPGHREFVSTCVLPFLGSRAAVQYAASE